MKIVIVGAGNIATFFSQKFHQAGFEIVQIISAELIHAQQLAGFFHCSFTNDIQQINKNADVYLFAVKDDILLELATQISLPNKLVIHTAGSIHLNELSGMSMRQACIWCVYSINKNNLPGANDIPLVVNAHFEEDLKIVGTLAKAISHNIYFLNDTQKSSLHLAAVFANNFTNHLFSISKNIVEAEDIPFEILHPIILDTSTKLLKSAPEKNQTGPAIRRDEKTMEKHLTLLQDETFKAIYRLLSASIQKSIQKD